MRGRAQFTEGIIAEFWAPPKPSGKAVVICDGAPSVPSKGKLAEFFARKGYWVFHMRYRGTWESRGEFLKHSPADDVDVFINDIERGFTDIYTRTTYYLDIREVTVIGASFAGPAVILATRNPLVKSAIAIAPVIDWQDQRGYESIEEFVFQLENGFPSAYRCPRKNFKKLSSKRFYSVSPYINELDSEKLFLVHARDDKTVPYKPTKMLAQKTGAAFVEYPIGGHLSSSLVMDRALWALVRDFLKR